jgi:hypothetical protein
MYLAPWGKNKEIVRLEGAFRMVNTWLKKKKLQRGLETRFAIIPRCGRAKKWIEDTFAAPANQVGTFVSSAYKLCQEMIETEYPPANGDYPFR